MCVWGLILPRHVLVPAVDLFAGRRLVAGAVICHLFVPGLVSNQQRGLLHVFKRTNADGVISFTPVSLLVLGLPTRGSDTTSVDEHLFSRVRLSIPPSRSRRRPSSRRCSGRHLPRSPSARWTRRASGIACKRRVDDLLFLLAAWLVFCLFSQVLLQTSAVCVHP